MISLFRKSGKEHVGEPIDDFNEYKIKIFRTISPNVALVCKNKLTGRVFVKNSGLAILFPWIESKFVSLAENIADYPKEKYKTVDDIELTIDLAIPFAVVDPMKYEFENNDALRELKIKTQNLLRQYVAMRTVDEMIKGNHTLQNFDPNRGYAAFEQESGIRVHDVYFKTVQLPQSLIDDYEKQKVQERENARLLAEAKAKKSAAIIDAETKLETAKYESEVNKILGEMANKITADELKQIIDGIRELNISPTLKLELLKTQILAKGKANIFYSMGGSQVDLAQYLMANGNPVMGPEKPRTYSLPPKYISKY